MEKKGKFDYILLETTGLADPGIMFYNKFLFCRVVALCFVRPLPIGEYGQFAFFKTSGSDQLFHQEVCVYYGDSGCPGTCLLTADIYMIILQFFIYKKFITCCFMQP